MEISKLSRELKSGAKGYAAAIRNLLEKLGAADSPLSVPPTMAVAYADALRERGLTLDPDGKLFDGRRRAKTPEEVAHVEGAQRAVEEACGHAAGILREAEVGEGGTLVWRGETLDRKS